MTATTDIVQKLWNLCHVLRDDGITYLQYVTELTYLLFLKMMQETEQETQLPEGYRWNDLLEREGDILRKFYREELFVALSKSQSKRVSEIFTDAQSALNKAVIIRKLIVTINDLDWFSAREDGLGNLYEGLLERNASEKKSGAGQYFTPRPLIDCMVSLIQPQPGEWIQDPAAGTGGFLIAADRYIKEQTSDLFDLAEQVQVFQRQKAFYGVELVQDA
jgi:type I restriction enzyme M protein